MQESEAVSTAIQNMECSVSEDKENVTPEVAESRTKSLPDHRPPLQPVTSTPAHQKVFIHCAFIQDVVSTNYIPSQNVP